MFEEQNKYKDGYYWFHSLNPYINPFKKREEDKNIFDRIKENGELN